MWRNMHRDISHRALRQGSKAGVYFSLEVTEKSKFKKAENMPDTITEN
jgi:hypothetical protein